MSSAKTDPFRSKILPLLAKRFVDLSEMETDFFIAVSE